MEDMEHIEGNSYEEYKKNLSRSRTWRANIYDGKVCLISGTCLLLLFLYILPFHAGNAHEIQGDQIDFGGPHDPQKVYYFEKLEILDAKMDTDDDSIYCIARFCDCDQKEWIILLTPGGDESLAEQIRLFDSLLKVGYNFTVSGYFVMRDPRYLPYGADAYLSIRGQSFAVNDGSNIISVNAEYLCGRTEENFGCIYRTQTLSETKEGRKRKHLKIHTH